MREKAKVHRNYIKALLRVKPYACMGKAFAGGWRARCNVNSKRFTIRIFGKNGGAVARQLTAAVNAMCIPALASKLSEVSNMVITVRPR